MNPAPGFKKYPGHRVTTQPSRAHVVVKLKGEVIADTRDAVELHETMSSDHVVAPVGDASYFSLKGGPENSVWSYEKPYDETMAIKERLAFYPDKFEITPS